LDGLCDGPAAAQGVPSLGLQPVGEQLHVVPGNVPEHTQAHGTGFFLGCLGVLGGLGGLGGLGFFSITFATTAFPAVVTFKANELVAKRAIVSKIEMIFMGKLLFLRARFVNLSDLQMTFG
jgi:hypothetical protein